MIGDCWALLGEDEYAETAYRRAATLRPEMPQGWLGLCRLCLLQGGTDAARSLHQENATRYQGFVECKQMAAQQEFFSRNYSLAMKLYSELAESDPAGGGEFYGAVTYSSALGVLRRMMGDDAGGALILQGCVKEELAKLKDTPRNPRVLYRLAAIESALSHRDTAIGYLRAAVDAGWVDHRSARLDPRFNGIHEDQQFQDILSGLSEKIETMRRQTASRQNRVN